MAYSPPTSPRPADAVSSPSISTLSSETEENSSENHFSPPSSPPAKKKRRQRKSRQKDEVSRSTIKEWQRLMAEKSDSGDESHQSKADTNYMDESFGNEVHGCAEPNEDEQRNDSSSSSASSVSKGSARLSAESSDSINNEQVSVASNEESSASDNSVNQSASSDSDSEDSDIVQNLLYDGATKTKHEAVLDLMKLFIKENWSKKSLGNTLKTVRNFLPNGNKLPKSVHLLISFTTSLSSPILEKKHFYCSKCLIEKDTKGEKCHKCDGFESGAFYEFPVDQQIKHMFEHRDLHKVIDCYKEQHDCDENFISDIISGSGYIKVKEKLNGRYDVVLLWNTDGVRMAKSSAMELWPILAVICEVPPHLRTSFMLVAGVWCDTLKPSGNLFLKPFVDRLKLVYEEGGVEWVHPQTKVQMKSNIAAPAFSADAPAKATVLEVNHFNHRYGCNICEQKTVRLPLSALEIAKKRRRKRVFTFEEDAACLRTGLRMDQQGTIAEQRGESIKGVLRKAVVSELPLFDRADCITFEYMHIVLSGVVRMMLNLWISVKGPWYIGDKVQDIDAFLTAIKVTYYINRIPRRLSSVDYWKAAELLFWLLSYSLPAVKDYLPKRYLQHWILLVGSMYSVLKNKISKAELERANVVLRVFVRDFGTLYGMKYYTYKMHQLLHLCLLVERWGLCWSTSTFIFENYNGVLGNLIHGTKHQAQELINNIKIAQGVQVLENVVERTRTNRSVSGEDEVLGKACNVTLDDTARAALQEAHVNEYVSINLRARVGKEIFTSVTYDENKKRSNCHIKCELGGLKEYGEIEYFIRTQEDILCIVRTYQVLHVDLFVHDEARYKIEHLIPVQLSNNVIIFPVSNISEKVMKVGIYLCMRPNIYETNL